jgi:restriction endonuclease Mrr
MDIVFQYPPELLQLLIDTIPLLCRSKPDVILFFKGAGVASGITNDLVRRINKDRASISKYEIARKVLIRLNEKGESTLRERREVLKRVTEFEDFSSCWPSDQMKAKGYVAEVRRLINIKDSFTRINLEREQERKKHQAEHQEKLKKEEQRRAKLSAIRADLLSLFSDNNSQRRGKALEGVLNRLFEASGILIREAFTITGNEGEGIVEQIDGVIEVDSHLYLVEMKWWNAPLGPGEVSQHLVRVYHRDQSRGIFISASGYTQSGINTCRDALQRSVFVLCKLEELVLLLEKEEDLKEFLRSKISAAIIHKNPLFEPLSVTSY